MRINVWIVLIVLIALFAATRLLRYHQNTQRICADDPSASVYASGDELTIMIDCRNGVAFRQRDQLLAPAIQERIGGDKKRSGSPLCRNRKGETDLVFTACLQDVQFLPDGTSRLLNIFRLSIKSRPRRVQ